LFYLGGMKIRGFQNCSQVNQTRVFFIKIFLSILIIIRIVISSPTIKGWYLKTLIVLNCKFRNVRNHSGNISPFLYTTSIVLNVSSVIVAVSSKSFILMWFIIEINMLSFILILRGSQNNLNSSFIVKYFLFQALRSVVIILLICGCCYIVNFLTLLILIKLGAAPFHMWIIRIIENLKSVRFFWLAVPQKIIPLRFLQIFHRTGHLIDLLLLIRIAVSTVHIIFQFKIMKIIAASSIYSTPWLVSSFIASDVLSWVLFFSYSFIQGFWLILIYWQLLKPDPLTTKNTRTMSYINLTTILILAGFPPRPLFFIKLNIVWNLLAIGRFIIGLSFIIAASLVIYSYLNMVCIQLVITRNSATL